MGRMVDQNENLVVVELKLSFAYDQVYWSIATLIWVGSENILLNRLFGE